MYTELNHLLFLYPPVPRTREYWGGGYIVPSNYYGSAAHEYTDSPPHLSIATTVPCNTEHSVYYYLTTAKWTKITKKVSPVGS